jgi:hypothetical protein
LPLVERERRDITLVNLASGKGVRWLAGFA